MKDNTLMPQTIAILVSRDFDHFHTDGLRIKALLEANGHRVELFYLEEVFYELGKRFLQDDYKRLDDIDKIFFKTDWVPQPLYRNFKSQGVKLINAEQENCQDKLLTHVILENAGIPNIETYPVNTGNHNKAMAKVPFPAVLKKRHAFQGEAVYKIADTDELMGYLQSGASEEYLIQPFIEEIDATDYRVFVSKNGFLAAIGKKSPEGDFITSNAVYQGLAFDYTPDDQTLELCLKSARALDIDIVGFDVFMMPEGPIICEANPNSTFELYLDFKGNSNLFEDVAQYIETY